MNKQGPGKIDRLVSSAIGCGVPVWVKDNAKYHTVIKEFPE